MTNREFTPPGRYVWSLPSTEWNHIPAYVGREPMPCPYVLDGTALMRSGSGDRHRSHTHGEYYFCPGLWSNSASNLDNKWTTPIPNPNQPTSQQENTMTTTAEEALTAIAEELRREATNRNWCRDYDAFVERVNNRVGRNVLQPLTLPRHTVRITLDVAVEGLQNPGARELERIRETIGMHAHASLTGAPYTRGEYSLPPGITLRTINRGQRTPVPTIAPNL